MKGEGLSPGPPGPPDDEFELVTNRRGRSPDLRGLRHGDDSHLAKRGFISRGFPGAWLGFCGPLRRCQGPSPIWRGHLVCEMRACKVWGPSPPSGGASGNGRIPTAAWTGLSLFSRGRLTLHGINSPASRAIPAPCGACRRDVSLLPISLGSSPLARGLLSAGIAAHRRAGAIPGARGLPKPPSLRCVPWLDHPRRRGASPGWTNWSMPNSGPSPAARGLPILDSKPANRVGTIPAQAGPAAATHQRCDHQRDHPRATGACVSEPGDGVRYVGPSPRKRGLLGGFG